ncbi:MAG TPA: YfhO family protein, partial [Myxococcales bacterium]|nr:YfhO family protein [Myxococcales bacterium]
GPAGEARLERLSPERMRIRVDAPGPRLLVVGEHFDPGWRARVDGNDAAVVRVDLCALGVELPAGAREVTLRFLPRGLVPGALAFAATLALLAALSVRRYRSAAAR